MHSLDEIFANPLFSGPTEAKPYPPPGPRRYAAYLHKARATEIENVALAPVNLFYPQNEFKEAVSSAA
jgi:hypothetical protein